MMEANIVRRIFNPEYNEKIQIIKDVRIRDRPNMRYVLLSGDRFIFNNDIAIQSA
jgi:hypothetical protein